MRDDAGCLHSGDGPQTRPACRHCVAAAQAVDGVLTETWKKEVHNRIRLWPVGVIAERVCQGDAARYLPFDRASGAHLAAALVDLGLDIADEDARRLVAASWWALRLAGRDVNEFAVLNTARMAASYRRGYLAGQLEPAGVTYTMSHTQ